MIETRQNSFCQPVYVRPKDIQHPTVLMGFAFMRPITLTYGWSERAVTQFSITGTVKCPCGSINAPVWNYGG